MSKKEKKKLKKAYKSLKQGLKELKLVLKGDLEPKTLDEFLKEQKK
jgi:hypothetical protein